jgi:hypothetical protein
MFRTPRKESVKTGDNSAESKQPAGDVPGGLIANSRLLSAMSYRSKRSCALL